MATTSDDDDSAPAPAALPANEPGPVRAPAPARPPRRAAVALAAIVGVLVAGVLAVAATAWWALRHERGSAWLASLLPRVTVTGPSGSLLGDFAAQRIDVALPGTAGTLRLDGARWHDLTIERGTSGRWLRIAVDTLHVDRVTLLPAAAARAPGTEPAGEPASLRLPVEVEVREASVDELRVEGAAAATLHALRGAVHLGADAGGTHRIDGLGARWQQVLASGSARIGTDRPFTTSVSLQLGGALPSLPNWQGAIAASGPLSTLHASATLRAPAAATRAAQALDVQTVLRPFAPWPLGQLDARVEALDLTTFAAAAPATALSGTVALATTAAAEPAHLLADLDNTRAGRWNEGLLPVRHARAELRARLDDLHTLDVTTLSAELGSARRDGGLVTGTGQWTPQRWTLAATLRRLVPDALDARAGEMRLDGTLTLAGSGFAAAAGSARSVAATAAIRGSSGKLARPVAVDVDAVGEQRGDALSLDVKRAVASADAARATLSGHIERAADDAPWQTKGMLALTDFDPRTWWPGSTDAFLQRGASRLNGRAEFDLRVPSSLPMADVLDAAAALRGRASVALSPSVLAGVPIEGDATLQNADGRAESTFTLLAAGNRLRGQGHADAARATPNERQATRAGSTGDDWQFDIDAPQLAGLAPWFGAATKASPASATAGRLKARARVTGRWPDVTSEGELEASAVRLADIAVDKASGRWRLGSAENAALNAHLVVDGAHLGTTAIEHLTAQLGGSARAHRLEVRAESKALPPEWVDALQPVAGTASATSASTTGTGATSATTTTTTAPARSLPTTRSTARLVAEGGLVDNNGVHAAGWRGVLHQFDVAPAASPAQPWASARELRGRVLWSGGPTQLDVEPGRADVLGAVLRWSRLSWRAADGNGNAPRLDVQADVDPLPIAPILARLQPDFGWGGDLTLGAHIDIRSAPAVGADIVVERRGGDLTVTDEYGSEALGLEQVRFGVSAQGGTWTFTQALSGTALGRAEGRIVARTSSNAAWPDAQTPIDGTLQLQVANLGTWGRWVPAGWRLTGELHANARVGGRFGAPEYTGHVDGAHLGVRNFVQGVNLSDGDAAIALQGSTARIEHFTAKGGAGTVKLEGGATFGAAPTATLTLTAEQLQLLGRVDRRIVASGSAALKLDRDTVGLDGSFKVDEGLVDFTRSDAPSLGDDVTVVRRPAVAVAGARAPGTAGVVAAADAAASAPAATSVSRKVALDLRVGLGEKLRVRGRGLDAGLRGELRITSPNGRLAVAGTVSAVDGTYAAYGQKLTIDRGLLTFAGAIENPRLDIEATRPNLDVRVGVAVTGTAQLPRVRLFSEPDMADIDKLSWLVLGRASEGVGSADTALLQSAALALLSGEGPGVTDRITHAIGLDDISLRQQTEGDVKQTIVSLGKQISKRWYVGYERGLNATTGSWQLIYRIARRLTVRAQAGGDNSLDLIWTLRWK